MATTFADIPGRVAELLGGRIVQWVPPDRRVGDYEGRHRTLEIFDVPPDQQRKILRQLYPARAGIERVLGGPLIILFHTPQATQRLYPEFSAAHKYRALAARMADWTQTPGADQPTFDPDDVARLTVEAA